MVASADKVRKTDVIDPDFCKAFHMVPQFYKIIYIFFTAEKNKQQSLKPERKPNIKEICEKDLIPAL